jgi:A/G-specific adenine glycosylase
MPVAIQGKILKYLYTSPRDFPWRHKITPYRIMIAEFMLQRTRAEQVEPVYKQFIKRYPSVVSLSKAKTKDIAQYTKHLGIHWRAKHFIAAAKFIVKDYKRRIPSSREKLLAIPGVGEYVAGAILTVAFQQPEWVIDSNIARFLNRYHGLGLQGEIRRKKEIIDLSRHLFNYKNNRKLLFGLLDFTAQVCLPRKPACSGCFLRKKCKYLKGMKE